MEAKDLLTIYIADNALINQKTTYYFAANALLVVPVANIYQHDRGTAALLCGLGLVFSIISFLSIARTCAYRDRWRKLLVKKDKEYAKLYSDSDFRLWAKIPSYFILMTPPFIGFCMWGWAFGTLQWG